jgi:hypothetical protein
MSAADNLKIRFIICFNTPNAEKSLIFSSVQSNIPYLDAKPGHLLLRQKQKKSDISVFRRCGSSCSQSSAAVTFDA